MSATAAGLGDAYPTPLTGQSELMPGVEVQPQEKGIGLGLAFVKTVVERHDGLMGVSSKLDPGSDFGFILPLTSTMKG